VNAILNKDVGIPSTYHQVEANPQGILEFIQSPLNGIQNAIDVILFVYCSCLLFLFVVCCLIFD
jgi:uncharacterized ion transporter superfamily protein YfcC